MCRSAGPIPILRHPPQRHSVLCCEPPSHSFFHGIHRALQGVALLGRADAASTLLSCYRQDANMRARASIISGPANPSTRFIMPYSHIAQAAA